MKRQIWIIMIILVTAALMLSACGTADPGKEQEVVRGGEASAEGSGAAEFVDTTDGLMDSLKAAGADVETGGEIQQAFFSPLGTILKVNGEDVQVFEYPTAEDAEREAETVSADGGSIGTSMVTWVAAPHFYRSGRIIALYVGENLAVIAPLETVLGEQFAGR